jgi:copper chaperone
MQAIIKVKGMSCQHCVASVTKTLSEIEGITDVQVDLDKGEATFSEQSPVAEQSIKDAITKIGFEVVD